MVDKHKPSQVLKAYGQKQAGKVRREQREAARLKMVAAIKEAAKLRAFEDVQEAWDSYLAWLQLAGFGFWLAVIVTLVSMAFFLYFVFYSGVIKWIR